MVDPKSKLPSMMMITNSTQIETTARQAWNRNMAYLEDGESHKLIKLLRELVP